MSRIGPEMATLTPPSISHAAPTNTAADTITTIPIVRHDSFISRLTTITKGHV
jgi:hypothetical protein